MTHFVTLFVVLIAFCDYALSDTSKVIEIEVDGQTYKLRNVTNAPVGTVFCELKPTTFSHNKGLYITSEMRHKFCSESYQKVGYPPDTEFNQFVSKSPTW